MMTSDLFPHQVRGIEFLRATPRALLADEMGLGKTRQAIEVCRGVSPLLVICPASVVGVWRREFGLWDPMRGVTPLIGSLSQRQKQLEGNLDVVLVNYEVVAKLLPNLQKVGWECLIIDEAHRVKNRRAQVTKSTQLLARPIPKIIELTGTPILNRPDDLWSLLNILRPDLYRSYWKFVEEYCQVFWNGFGWEVGGPKAPRQLAQEISPLYLRREKGEVLKLPEKIVSKIWVPLEGSQLREYREMRCQLLALLESGEAISALTAVSQLLRLRQICVDPNILVESREPLSGVKARALLELLESRNSGKVVIFSQWSRAVYATARLLESLEISHVVLTGETPQRSRSEIIHRFQTDPSIKALIATIGAGGVGVTLTAADTAIFLDKDWTPALNLQAQDRLHRVGQASTVWVYEILVEGTVEEYVEKKLSQKSLWSEKILGEEILSSRSF